MTANQINLRAVKETERHNRVQEDIGYQSNEISKEHYERADHAALLQAYASQAQASAALQNAATNAINAATNQYNAQTQRMLAESQISYNEGMLGINEYKAKTERGEAQLQFEKLKYQQYYDSFILDFKERETQVKEREQTVSEFRANLEGLKFKEGIRQFDLSYGLDVSEYQEDRRHNKVTEVTNFIGGLFKGIGTNYFKGITFGGN